MSEQKVVRMYRLNQEKIDEALQNMADFILEVASTEKLLEIKKQLDSKLEVGNE